MPMDLSFAGIVNDIMLRSGVGVTLLAIILYRLIAVSVLPCLVHKGVYCIFCLSAVGLFLYLSPCVEFSIGVLILVFSFFSPYFCLGFIRLLNKWSLGKVISVSIFEIILSPLWFFIILTIALLVEGGE